MQVWKKPDFLSSKKQMSWQDLIDYEDSYEICTEYPYVIRKKSTGNILKESIDKSRGYYRVHLYGKGFLKHRLIAKQFIPNPDNLPCVDHINRDKTDNHLFNLRWCTSSENQKNKSSNYGIEYEFVDYGDEPEDLIQVTDYGKHELEDYYYSPSQNLFYFDNGVKFRILYTNYNNCGVAFVYAFSTKQKRVAICYTKFKKLYNLQ